ncbi:MAG: chemotaxis protein CheD, partial [Thermogutta sp.]|nr:chemotaxis protein CheD [Thermogutta sp.]
MPTSATAAADAKQMKTLSVGMGQAIPGDRQTQLAAILGSCIAVVLWHPRMNLGALAHVVLPDSHGKSDMPAKFADTAVPFLVRMLESQGCHRSGLTAKLAGGACMFRGGGPLQIGDDNIAACRTHLRRLGIPIAAEDLGG